MENKYSDIHKKTPKEAAEIVGKVEKNNYFAHSIREIEMSILKYQSKHYHIITYHTETGSQKSKIKFYDERCEIRLPAECDEMDDKKVRLVLAHELGHLVYNINKLGNSEMLKNATKTDGEELYAWVFAYHLVKIKSDEHKNNNNLKKFIYNRADLKDFFLAIVKERNATVYDAVKENLLLNND